MLKLNRHIPNIITIAVWIMLFIPALNVGQWLWIWTGIIALEYPDDFELFNKSIPPKEKLRLPGQIF